MMLIYQATLPICEPKKAKFDEKIVRWTLNPTFLLFYMKKKHLLLKICNYTKMRMRYTAPVSGYPSFHTANF